MMSRCLYLKIVGSICSIVLLSLVGAWLLITGVSYFLSFVCLVLILLTSLFIIRLTNGLNRKTSLFFEALRNNDSTQHYPASTGDPFLNSLHAEMNRITEQFSRNSRETEEKKMYYESLLRVLTHEIGNSLTPIRSLSADLLKYAEAYTTAQIRDSLEVIHDQADNLASFLESYRRLTYLPDPEPEEIVVTELFQKLERLLCAEPGSGCVRYHSPSDLTLQADPNLLVLALLNLIRNALQAIDEQAGGIVSVQASCVDGKIGITVSDNGPGIPPERLPLVFTPFFSTKSGGSGIGLSISRRILQLQGGELTAQSIPYVKTVFTMNFQA